MRKVAAGAALLLVAITSTALAKPPEPALVGRIEPGDCAWGMGSDHTKAIRTVLACSMRSASLIDSARPDREAGIRLAFSTMVAGRFRSTIGEDLLQQWLDPDAITLIPRPGFEALRFEDVELLAGEKKAIPFRGHLIVRGNAGESRRLVTGRVEAVRGVYALTALEIGAPAP